MLLKSSLWRREEWELGPAPELTPGPALAHSTCYSMAGSTWGKNTNFHAFMASKKSNFQIIFNITCSYWAARSSQNVLQVSNRHWETIWDTDSVQRFLEEECRDLENTENLGWCQTRITRLGRMIQLIGPGLRAAAGPCWCKLVASLKRIFVMWANLRILCTACKHCRDLET